jgi:Domain of Unknown Function (DUF326)
MNRRNVFFLFSLVAAGLFAFGVAGLADDQKKDDRDLMDHGPHMECSKACDDCRRVCDACSVHCAKLIAEGHKDHLHTLQTCQDCATHCSAASAITARRGPFADLICTACAEACKRCGDACEKHKHDEIMKKCAAECRKCEKACREMLKHVGGSHQPM